MPENDLTDPISNELAMDRKTFLSKLGRFSIFVGLMSLGSFLFVRNTCGARDLSGDSQRTCQGCGQLKTCGDTLAKEHRRKNQPEQG